MSVLGRGDHMGYRGKRRKVIIMDVRTVVDLLSEVTYKPGWSFDVHADERRHESAVRIKVRYAAQNTDSEWAPDYAEPVAGGARAEFIIMAGVLHSAEHVYRALLDIILCIETHEAREFFGVGGRILPEKPFHPHTIQGMENWLKVTDDWHGRVAGDMQFGAV